MRRCRPPPPVVLPFCHLMPLRHVKPARATSAICFLPPLRQIFEGRRLLGHLNHGEHTMKVRAITGSEELCELESRWNALAGWNPFLSWDWLATWWMVYGSVRSGGRPSRKQPRVLAVYDGPDTSQLVGVAPLYLEKTVAKGNVLRLLGTGEVCTDHLSVVCGESDRGRVADALAEHLTHDDDWDAIELTGVDAADEAWRELVAALGRRECEVTSEKADACWRVELPDTWDEYVARQSKSHRKQLRRAERRVLESDRIAWHRVHDEAELDAAWHVFVDLHQRRRKSLGEPGCFASRAFGEFHRQVAERLLRCGRLRLSWLELDGSPVAAEYHFASDDTTFAYQGGVDPERLNEEPGRLSTILCLRTAIEEGHRWFDFMRGDEPYKAHWRAGPQPTVDYRVVPNRRLARLRGRVVQVADSMTDWLKTGVSTFTGPSAEGAV